MELRLRQLIDQLMRVSDIRNINTNNPVKVTVEHPNSGEATIIVVAYIEPYQYPLPYNVTWIVADPRSQYYKKALKRSSKDPGGDYVHTWNELFQFMDIFDPPQWWDEDDNPNLLPEEFWQHIEDTETNPHAVTADAIEAVKRGGDTMSGPLILHGDPGFEREAANKRYVDSLVSGLTDTMQVLQSNLAHNRSLIDANTTHIGVNHSGILSNLAQIQQNIVDIQNNLASIIINTDSIGQNVQDIAQLFDITSATNSAVQQLRADLDNLIQVANMTGYTHEQPNPSSVWTVTHNKGSSNFQWSVIDDTGEQVLPDTIIATDSNNVTIRFAQPIAGKAALAFQIH
jgi:hypothetical protein